ncbi:unnamed protein product [Protopolystoma xenopodis]|uniref:Uncharacterized protein n=1 Tax=Protopolystoma xenopodis TaxID=117903 RepID=A0A3S4ZQF7_9PLAT|nr:unnamed protein product [Protopolystoma xenopodis]
MRGLPGSRRGEAKLVHLAERALAGELNAIVGHDKRADPARHSWMPSLLFSWVRLCEYTHVLEGHCSGLVKTSRIGYGERVIGPPGDGAEDDFGLG